eukprot:jgi/Mesvir1/19398/Mv10431-RA.2
MVATLTESERYATAALFTLAMGTCPCALAISSPEISVVVPDKTALEWRRFRERTQLAAYRLLKLPPSSFTGLLALSQSGDDELHAHVASFTRVLLGWSYSGPAPQWPDYAETDGTSCETSATNSGHVAEKSSGHGGGAHQSAQQSTQQLSDSPAIAPTGISPGSSIRQDTTATLAATPDLGAPTHESSGKDPSGDDPSHTDWVSVPRRRPPVRRDPPHPNALSAVWSLLLAVTSFSYVAMERGARALEGEEERYTTGEDVSTRGYDTSSHGDTASSRGGGVSSFAGERVSCDAASRSADTSCRPNAIYRSHSVPVTEGGIRGLAVALERASMSDQSGAHVMTDGSGDEPASARTQRASAGTGREATGGTPPQLLETSPSRGPGPTPLLPSGGSGHGAVTAPISLSSSSSGLPATSTDGGGGAACAPMPTSQPPLPPPGTAAPRVPQGSSAAMSLWFRERLDSTHSRHKPTPLSPSSSCPPASPTPGAGSSICGPSLSGGDAHVLARTRSQSQAAHHAHLAGQRCPSAPLLGEADGTGGACACHRGGGGEEEDSARGSMGGQVAALWEGGMAGVPAGAVPAWEYDARTRTALKRVAGWLGVELTVLAGLETTAAYEAEAMAAQACALRPSQPDTPQLVSPLSAPPPPLPAPDGPSPYWERFNRRVKIGLAAAGGGVLLAVTGGLAAPALAAAVGAIATATASTAAAAGAVLGPVCVPAVAMGSVAAAGLGTAAAVAATQGGAVVIAGGFGVAGARLTGLKVAKRTGGVKEFEFVPVGPNHEGGLGVTRLAVTVCMSGWIVQPEDFTRPWACATEDAETHAVVWESAILLELGRAITDFLKNGIVTSAVKEMAMRTILQGLLMALSFASAIVAAAQLIDNPWSLGMDRAVKAGRVLADLISARVHGRRPITLLGYSLGAKAIFHCLEELAARGDLGAVETVALFAAPVPADVKRWASVRTAVAGRLLNVFSSNDLLLAIMFRAQCVSRTGLTSIIASTCVVVI